MSIEILAEKLGVKEGAYRVVGKPSLSREDRRVIRHLMRKHREELYGVQLMRTDVMNEYAGMNKREALRQLLEEGTHGHLPLIAFTMSDEQLVVAWELSSVQHRGESEVLRGERASQVPD